MCMVHLKNPVQIANTTYIEEKKIKNYLPTKLSICSSSPSASPLSRSSATIMKSLSGNSNCSLFCMWAKCWFRVCSTRLTHRLKTGSQYGRKPSCSAVATEERHSNKGNRSLSSSLSALHFCNEVNNSDIVFCVIFQKVWKILNKSPLLVNLQCKLTGPINI